MYDHLNQLLDYPFIPSQAFLFVPYRTTSDAESDDFRKVSKNATRRLLFEGWAQKTYTQYQVKKLKELDQYISQKEISLDPRWDKSWKLRWLLSVDCDMKKCISEMQTFIKYQDRVRDIRMSPSVSKYLVTLEIIKESRDSHYRPILVFDVDKILKMDMTEEEILQTQTYFLEYVIRNLFIPGQVENWVALVDTGGNGLLSMFNQLKNVSVFLMDTFRSRMFAMYVLNATTSIHVVWTLGKPFLAAQTIEKLNIYDEGVPIPLIEYCNPSQLEVKYGGKLANIQGKFWPPRIFEGPYTHPKHTTTLLTKEEYTRYYKEKILYNTKFHRDNIINVVNPELRLNTNLQVLKDIEKKIKGKTQLAEDQPNKRLTEQALMEKWVPLDFSNLLNVDSFIK